MKNKISEVIAERLANINGSNYINVSYRPSHKIASMIEIMCEIYGENKANLFHAKVSQMLADFILSSKENIKIINTVMKSIESEDISRSSLGILLEREIIKVDYKSNNPYIKDLKDILKGKDDEQK